MTRLESEPRPSTRCRFQNVRSMSPVPVSKIKRERELADGERLPESLRAYAARRRPPPAPRIVPWRLPPDVLEPARARTAAP